MKSAEQIAESIVRGNWTEKDQINEETDIPAKDWRELEKRISQALTRHADEVWNEAIDTAIKLIREGHKCVDPEDCPCCCFEKSIESLKRGASE